MATHARTTEQTVYDPERPAVRTRAGSGFATGTIRFAATMMMIAGGLHILQGIAALTEDSFFVLGSEYAYEFDVTTWGWVHLIGGILVIAAGIALFSRNAFARTVAVTLAVVSIVANFMWLPWYPIWSVVTIAISLLAIWGATANGRDTARDSSW